MLLPLSTPVGSNFIKDFPSTHAFNAELIDAYANSSLTSDPLKSYVPILTAVTTNPVIGTGGSAVIRGFYYEIFDQIFTWGEFRFGTTGNSAGSGTYILTLPFPILNNVGSGTLLGSAGIWNNGTSAERQSASVVLATTTTFNIITRLNSGGAQRSVSHVTPFAWAASDGISWFAHYQRISS